MTVSLPSFTSHYWYVWCDDHSNCVFNIAVCKSEKEAIAQQIYWSMRHKDRTYTITKEAF